MAESDKDRDGSNEMSPEINESREEKETTVERVFAEVEIPPWRKQLTFRAMAVSLVLSVIFCFIVMKLNLTTGLIPSMSISAGLLGFFSVKVWTKVVVGLGMSRVLPFTRQENTVIQTCVVASTGIASSGK